MRLLLLFASLWFGCWHNLQQVANVGEECHHSRETNFKKVANSRGCLRCTLPQFLSCRNPSTASASIASSCGASIFVKRHVPPKTKSHHTRPMCEKNIVLMIQPVQPQPMWPSPEISGAESPRINKQHEARIGLQWKSLGGCNESSELESVECIRDRRFNG